MFPFQHIHHTDTAKKKPHRRNSNCLIAMMLQLLLAVGCLAAGAFAQCDKSILPELTYRLGGNNLEWPCQSTKNIYTTTGRYIPKNVIATRTQIHKDEAFIALPRYKPGVPFTLGRISLQKGACQTAIAPYPCWALQEEGNCQALQSVVDLFIDGQVCSNGRVFYLCFNLIIERIWHRKNSKKFWEKKNWTGWRVQKQLNSNISHILFFWLFFKNFGVFRLECLLIEIVTKIVLPCHY